MSTIGSISSAGGTGQEAIEKAYYNQFRRGFDQSFQQFDTKLAQNFEIEPMDSEFQTFDRIGIAEEMVEDNVRFADNPNSEIPHDRRRISMRDFELGKFIDPKDLKRVLTDPTNAYTRAMQGSGHRKMDDIVLERIFDVSKAGKKGEVDVVFAPSTAGKISVGAVSRGNSRPIVTDTRYELIAGDTEGIDIAVDYVDSGAPADSGITLAKLKAIRFTMQRLEAIGQTEILDCYITSAQAEQLLGIEEIINSDYAVRKALAEGNTVSFMGFRFINTERLLGSGTSADPRQCIVAKRQSLKLGMARNLTVDVWRDSSKKNIPYIYMKLCMDATRMWGEVTARLNCLD
jgi:hypothetical protein